MPADRRRIPIVSIVAASLALALPIVFEFIETGLVPRFPTAILATGIMLLAFHSLFSGLILDTVTHGRREVKRLSYLGIPRRAPERDLRAGPR